MKKKILVKEGDVLVFSPAGDLGVVVNSSVVYQSPILFKSPKLFVDLGGVYHRISKNLDKYEVIDNIYDDEEKIKLERCVDCFYGNCKGYAFTMAGSECPAVTPKAGDVVVLKPTLEHSVFGCIGALGLIQSQTPLELLCSDALTNKGWWIVKIGERTINAEESEFEIIDHLEEYTEVAADNHTTASNQRRERQARFELGGELPPVPDGYERILGGIVQRGDWVVCAGKYSELALTLVGLPVLDLTDSNGNQIEVYRKFLLKQHAVVLPEGSCHRCEYRKAQHFCHFKRGGNECLAAREAIALKLAEEEGMEQIKQQEEAYKTTDSLGNTGHFVSGAEPKTKTLSRMRVTIRGEDYYIEKSSLHDAINIRCANCGHTTAFVDLQPIIDEAKKRVI